MTFNISVLLRESAAAHPDRDCVVLGERAWTYAEVDAAADLVAANLRGLGLPTGASVAVQLPDIPQFLFSYFGLVRAGLVMVPLNPLLTPREIAHHLSDSDTAVLITVDTAAEAAVAGSAQAGGPDGGPTVFVVSTGAGERPAGTRDFAELLAPCPAVDLAPTQADDTAVIIYTSGTTGTPKGAELTHFGIYMNTTASGTRVPIRTDDVVLAMLPFFHVYGLTSVLNICVRHACTMVLLPRFKAGAALDLVERHRITRISAVPTMLIGMVEDPGTGRDLSSVRQVISGGSALPQEVLRRFEAKFPQATVLEGYGLSESTSSVSLNLSREERRVMSIGKPLWGTECRVVDAEGRELGPGTDQVGELLFRGPTIMKGYYRNPEATAATLVDGWLRTGDMGYRDEDGFLYVVDRKKELILRGGYNVYPREVEEVIATHPAVSEVAVMGRPHPSLGSEVVAVVSTRPGMSVTAEEIIEHAKASLAAYKYPREVHVVDGLPKTATGKIRKRDLAATLLEPAPGAESPAS